MPTSPVRHGAHRRKLRRKETQKEYNTHRRQNQGFYNSKQWRSVRSLYISKNPLCEWCKKQGITAPADVVDHIVEIKDGGDTLSESNLQSLCHAHHNKKSAQARAER